MAISTTQVLVRLAQLMGSRTLAVHADLAFGVALEIVAIGFGVAGPYLLKVIIDTHGYGGEAPVILVMLVLLFVATWTGGSVVSTVRMVFTARVIDALNRVVIVSALQRQLPASATARDGDSSRTLGLLERLPFSLQVVCEGLIWRTVPMFVQVIACFAVIARLTPLRYVLIMAAMLGGFAAATWYGSKRHQAFSTGANAANAAVSQTLGDVLRNARRVVLNGAFDTEFRHIVSRLGEKRLATERMWWSLVLLATLQYGVVGLGLLVLLILAGVDVGAGRMTVGDFVLLQAYAARLTTPLSSFGLTLSQAGVSIANIADVFEVGEGGDVSEVDADPIAGPAGIDLDDIGFQYGPGLPGIQGVTARVAPGDFTVIVGSNGSGKSTLAQVIAGILEPSNGRVRINGADISSVPGKARHRYVMYVPQVIGLFHRSLGENALYPPTTQTEGTLAELLADWGFYEPGRNINLGVMVGEQGERLSGGQIQKLELARIAGVKVPAFILDESTSSLDPNSEARVIQTLMKGYNGDTTLILITHRPTLAAIADQVLFMRAGRLIAAGKHEDLLRALPDYAALWTAPEEQIRTI